MDVDVFLAVFSFAFISAFTPGPNNMMLLASGVNFDLRRSIPHILGISLGHGLMVFLLGLGLAGVFKAWPEAILGLKVVSVVYMLWLALKIARAGAPGAQEAGARPISFLQAAAFQWVNPKAYAIALGALAAYVVTPSLAASVSVALGFIIAGIPPMFVWVMAGQKLRAWLEVPRRRQIFNIVMALLLVASLWPVLTMGGLNL